MHHQILLFLIKIIETWWQQ